MKSSEPKTVIKSSVHRARRSSPQLPEDILSLIIRACIPIFRVLFFQTRFQSDATGESFGRISIHDVPHLVNLKLVNRYFYDEVWLGIPQKFTGRLDIENIHTVYVEHGMHDRVNNLFMNQLSCLAPRVEGLYYQVDNMINLDQIRFELFPALRIVYLTPFETAEYRWDLCDYRLEEALAGKVDEGVLACVVANLNEHQTVRPILSSLRGKGYKVVLQYLFEVSHDGCGMFYVDCTNTDSLGIQSRVSVWEQSDDDAGHDNRDLFVEECFEAAVLSTMQMRWS